MVKKRKKKYLLKCVFYTKKFLVNKSINDDLLNNILKDIISVINSFLLNNKLPIPLDYRVFDDNKGFWVFINKKTYKTLFNKKNHFKMMFLHNLRNKNPIYTNNYINCKFYFFNDKKSKKFEYYY